MIVNGIEKNLSDLSVLDLLNHFDQKVNRVVVEVDGEIVPPEHFGTHWLSGDQVIEIVSFVGGG